MNTMWNLKRKQPQTNTELEVLNGKHENLLYKLKNLEERIYALENPFKFNIGDTVVFHDKTYSVGQRYVGRGSMYYDSDTITNRYDIVLQDVSESTDGFICRGAKEEDLILVNTTETT